VQLQSVRRSAILLVSYLFRTMRMAGLLRSANHSNEPLKSVTGFFMHVCCGHLCCAVLHRSRVGKCALVATTGGDAVPRHNCHVGIVDPPRLGQRLCALSGSTPLLERRNYGVQVYADITKNPQASAVVAADLSGSRSLSRLEYLYCLQRIQFTTPSKANFVLRTSTCSRK
jgi:hypothetical protein